MYPVNMQQFQQRPKKYKTTQRGRKRQNTSLAPNKSIPPPPEKEKHTKDSEDGKQQKLKKGTIVPFASQLDEIARNKAVQPKDKEKRPSKLADRDYMTMPARSGRSLRQLGNGLYDTFGRGRFPIGMPIDSTVPFPNPVPPPGGSLSHTRTSNTVKDFTGIDRHAGYVIERTQDGCNNVEFERAAEWGDKYCNACDPDH